MRIFYVFIQLKNRKNRVVFPSGLCNFDLTEIQDLNLATTQRKINMFFIFVFIFLNKQALIALFIKKGNA